MASGQISVVTVSYRTGPILTEVIETLLREPDVCEVIVVNNGNPPFTIAKLQALSESEPKLRVLTGHGNVGFSRGCNLGARAASGEFLLFWNPDALPDTGAVRALLSEAMRQPPLTLLGGRLLNPDGSEQRGGRRLEVTPESALREVLARFRREDGEGAATGFNQHRLEAPDDVTAVPVISGACMLTSAEGFWEVGGFDEGYFLHVEDIDLCHRYRMAGGEVLYVPWARIYHQQGSSDASPLAIEWHKARGFIRYFWKNFRRQRSYGLLLLTTFGILGRFLLISIARPFGGGRAASH